MKIAASGCARVAGCGRRERIPTSLEMNDKASKRVILSVAECVALRRICVVSKMPICADTLCDCASGDRCLFRSHTDALVPCLNEGSYRLSIEASSSSANAEPRELIWSHELRSRRRLD